MQITFLHQVTADALTVTIGKKDIVRQDTRSPSLTRLIHAAVNVLQEIQLLIAGGECEVIAGSPCTALLGSIGRIGQDNIIPLHTFAKFGQGIAKINGAANIVQHGIHQS